MLSCIYFNSCNGCSEHSASYDLQLANKIKSLKHLIKENSLIFDNDPNIISLGEFKLRDRIDFTIEQNEQQKNGYITGFYDKTKKLLNIDNCLQLSPELQIIYQEFNSLAFNDLNLNIKKGSVRLRSSSSKPTGLKGVWLDFANTDIKNLLDDGRFLNKLLDLGYHIEIGQKHKILTKINQTLKLADPASKPWFSTIDNQNNPIDLYCSIADFTQPSAKSAHQLVQTCNQWIQSVKTPITSVIEFGSGIGQFTLSFLANNLSVIACEINEASTEQLILNSQLHKLDKNLTTLIGDFHKKDLPQNTKADLIFVNPARSGLKNFTDQINKIGAPYLIYVSCFPQTMCADLARLTNYKIKDITIVDQFPQTEHFESLVFLEKTN